MNTLEQNYELLKNRLNTASQEIIRTGNENLDLKDKIKELTAKIEELEQKLVENKKLLNK